MTYANWLFCIKTDTYQCLRYKVIKLWEVI